MDGRLDRRAAHQAVVVVVVVVSVCSLRVGDALAGVLWYNALVVAMGVQRRGMQQRRNNRE